MELVFERDNLDAAIKAASMAVTRSSLPILSNVLVNAEEGRIRLAATDLEVGVKVGVEGEIVEAGSITIPAKKLGDIVRELPADAKVTLKTLASDRVEINCGSARFRIASLTDEEFPSLPEIGDDLLTVSSGVLCRLIQKTAFAVSTEETRHFLNGVYLCINSESIKMVATDGRRIAVATQHQPNSVEKEVGVIIPSKAINNILKTFTADEDVRVAVLENQIAFATDDITLISRLIEGEYPDYKAVMAPAMSNEINMVARTEQLLSVIRRVSLLSNPKVPSVKMEVSETELKMSASTPELGEAQEQMEVSSSSKAAEVRFNARYVVDVLRNIESDAVRLAFKDSLSPVLVIPQIEDGDREYKCVIMPMRM